MAKEPVPEIRAYSIRRLTLSGFLRNVATRKDVIAQTAPPARNSIRFVVDILWSHIAQKIKKTSHLRGPVFA